MSDSCNFLGPAEPATMHPHRVGCGRLLSVIGAQHNQVMRQVGLMMNVRLHVLLPTLFGAMIVASLHVFQRE